MIYHTINLVYHIIFHDFVFISYIIFIFHVCIVFDVIHIYDVIFILDDVFIVYVVIIFYLINMPWQHLFLMLSVCMMLSSFLCCLHFWTWFSFSKMSLYSMCTTFLYHLHFYVVFIFKASLFLEAGLKAILYSDSYYIYYIIYHI